MGNEPSVADDDTAHFTITDSSLSLVIFGLEILGKFAVKRRK
jgi:hypothetical protein